MAHEALGLIETTNLAAAMEASTAATQTATASVSSVTLIDALFVIVKIEGEMAAVQAAIEAGAHAAQQSGSLICARIIPQRDGVVITQTPRKRSRPATVTQAAPKRTVVASQKVSKPKPKAAPSLRVTPAVSAAPAPSAPRAVAATMSMDQLEALPVSKLRQYARGLAGLPIQGRQISMANKQQLLEAIEKIA